ncbi:MAG: CHASE3 domain-containing protein [Proteobacteria bacterium]|nr:CHASE3 domain-containing protein [Pseudomonadota bacterium]
MNFSNLKTKPKILIGICSPMILLLVLGGVAVYNINTIVKTSGWVDHTRVVLAEASGIIGSAVDMETGMRGYLLAGEEGFLDPYKGGEKQTYERIGSLKETVNDNPKQVKRLEEVEKILREWQSEVTEPTIGLRREIGDAKTMNDMADLVGEARGKKFFDKFRGQIATFIGREASLLKERRAEFQTAQGSVGENFKLVNDTVGWVDHTHVVLAQAASILAHAVDMETGMRGFLLAGREEFLAPYKNGQKAFFAGMKDLQKTVDDNPAQVARLKKTEKIIGDWIAQVTDPAIKMRRQVGPGKGSVTLQDIETLVAAKKGKVFFDAFRAGIAEFSKIEADLMAKRQQTAVTAKKKVDDGLAVMKTNEGWVTHTYEVIERANSILASAVNMETGMRGYLLAGEEGFLAPYTDGSKRFFELTASLSKTVNDNPAQVKLLAETVDNIKAWKSEVTEPTIALRRQIGDAKTMDDMADVVGQAKGKVYFDKFRQIMADFGAEEEGLMKQRQEDNLSTVSNTYFIIAACIILAIAIGVTLAWLIGNAIANPIILMTRTMGELAEGNLEVDIPAQGRVDEIGDMAATVQVFKDNAIKVKEMTAEQEASRADQEAKEKHDQEEKEAAAKRTEEEKRETMVKLADDFETSVGQVVQSVTSSSAQMKASAQAMSSTAEETDSQSTAVAAAAEQASANVQTVAAAAEELSASIAEIGRQVTKSSEIAGDAVEKAQQTDEQVRGLANAANKIGEVVEMITDIAEQTNLLALNATIEAARAGDAGKGFAVVASEVKSLAAQTAKATDEISAQIDGIQAATDDAVSAIQDIGKTIGDVNDITTTIAAAVEEQSAATEEIARNVQQAAQGTDEVTLNITGVTKAASETGEAAGEILKVSGGLEDQSEMLRHEVEKFLETVRAA